MNGTDETPAGRDRVLSWLGRVRGDRGLRFAEDGGGWRFVPYDELGAAARASALRLREHGVSSGDVVSIVVPTSPDFVAAFYGVVAAGGTASPLVPPGYLQGDWVAHIASALRVARPRAILAAPELHGIVGEAVERAGLAHTPPLLAPAEASGPGLEEVPGAAVSLLQFTSGSSGRPRGVRVAREQLSSQIAMLDEWLQIDATQDALTAWLPLYHDMGLISLLTAVDAIGDAWLLRPEQFILQPRRWLEALSGDRGTISATPNFGFSFLQKRLDPAELDGLDLTRWKAVIVGAERLDPCVFARFADGMSDHGFSARAFAPAYGLAEATLAVSGLSIEEEVRVTLVDWSQLTFGAPVQVLDHGGLSSERVGDGRGWIMGCGRPLGDTQVRILDDDGHELPDGHFGQIHVIGPSVALGYLSETSGPSDFDGGVLATGDAGFLLDGELHVVGRIGEALKVRGRNVYAEDLESKLTSIPGVPQGRCVALAGNEAGVDTVTILLETEPGPWIEQARGVLRHELGADVTVRLLQVPRSGIERTSSGKPRRRATWQRLRDGEVTFETIAEWGGPEVLEPV